MLTINEQIRMLTKEKVKDHFFTTGRICRGLCSLETFKKIRSGGAVTDLRLMKVLIQRLGKCPNKLEVIIPKDILDIETAQLRFEDAVDTDNEEGAKEQLKFFQMLLSESADNNVALMYFLRNSAIFKYRFAKEKEQAFYDIERAIEATLPNWQTEGLENLIISTTELENLLAYCLLKYSEEDSAYKGLEFSKGILEYINKHIDDEEELANILPKCRWVRANLLLKKHDYAKAVEESEKGLGLLRKYAILHLMLPFIRIIVDYGKGMFLSEPYENYQQYNALLEWLTSNYDVAKYKFDSLFVRSNKLMYHYDAEVILGQRKMLGYTQEELAFRVGSTADAISKIEHGKRSPNKTTFPKYMKELGLEWGKQNTAMISEDFHCMEMEEEVNVQICMGEYDVAEKLIKELEAEIDIGYRRNVKRLAVLKTTLEVERGTVDLEKVIDENKKYLSETYPFFDEKIKIERPPFSDEALLLIEIGACLDRSNRIDEAAALYGKLVEIIDNSNVDTRLRQRMYGRSLSNYAQVSESEEYLQKAIQYRLRCRSLSGVFGMLSVISVILYRDSKEKSKTFMYNALYAAELIFSKKNCRNIKKFIDEYF